MGEAQRDEIAKLEALYAANPEGRVFTHLAEAYRKAGDLERARETLEEGLSRHPDSATAFVVLGRVAFDSNDQASAREAFGRALALDEGNLVAHRYLGELALGRGDRNSALRHFGELLARNPADESVLARVRELSAPESEGYGAPGDLPALAVEAVPAEGPGQAEADEAQEATPPEVLWAFGEEESGEREDALSADDGGPAGDEAPLPSLDLDELPVESGTSAEPWSWEEPPAEEADAFDAQALPDLDGFEPRPEFDGGAVEDEEPWRAYAVGEAAVSDALADAGAVEAEALLPADAAGADTGYLPGRTDEVMTETMAELYRSQGFPDRAAEVYRSLLDRHPEDPRLRERLAEAEREAEARVAEAPLEAREDADEPWQGAADSAFTGGSSAVVGSGMPYAWGSSEEDAAAEPEPAAGSGPPIGSYFDSLLQWRPAPAPAADHGSEPETAEVEPPATPEAGALPEAELAAAAEVLPEPELAAEAEVLPEPELAAEAEVLPEPELAAEAEVLPEPELTAETEMLPEAELILEEPAAEAEAFTGWSPDMLQDPAPAEEPEAAPERMPWEVPEPPSLAASAPEAPASADPAPGEPPAAGPQDGAEAAPDSDSEEDEDLEMFRSWLQSLKK